MLTSNNKKVTFWEKIYSTLPGLKVIKEYHVEDIGSDILAGLVISLVLLPSTLAYAELAGFGPVAGIYSAIAASIAYFLFTTSRHMNVGPDGAVALLVGAAILPLTEGDPAKAIIAGTWLAMFTGLILVMAAKFKLGVIASFLSTPVLLGYLNGAALVIIISQWGKFFGITLDHSDFIPRLIEWFEKISQTHMETFITGIITLILLIIARRLIKRIPPLVPVFFIALIAGLIIDFNGMGVEIIGKIRDLAPQSMDFSFNFNDIATLAMGALGLSMLIFPEGILLSRSMAEKHNYNIDPDKELMALGVANIATAAIQGFSVGGSQTRTLVNSASGGKTQMANLASIVFLIAFMIFAADAITHLPKVTIAAILIYTGFTLIDLPSVKFMWTQHRQTAWIAITTTAAVVFIGVLPGILLGTSFSIAILLSELARPQDALLGQKKGSEQLHDLGDDDLVEGIPGLVVYRFYGPVVFANVTFFIERLQGFIAREKSPVKQVIIDARAITTVDYTAMEKLHPFFRKLQQQGIVLVIARAHQPLRETRRLQGMEPIFDKDKIYNRVTDAVNDFTQQKNT